MKKLLLISLVIFFTICSRSWADEIKWECADGSRYMINTEIPMVYERIEGSWVNFQDHYAFVDKVSFSSSQNNITIKFRLPAATDKKVFDLSYKEIINIGSRNDYDKWNYTLPCFKLFR